MTDKTPEEMLLLQIQLKHREIRAKLAPDMFTIDEALAAMKAWGDKRFEEGVRAANNHLCVKPGDYIANLFGKRKTYLESDEDEI